MTIRCVFCGAALSANDCVWVRLSDDSDFVCCPTMCAPMRESVESLRRERAIRRHQLDLPLVPI